MPKRTEPDQPLTKETRRGGRKKTRMSYNRYGDDFLTDKIQPEELGAEMVNMGVLVADKKWQIINDSEHSWQEDHTLPEKEVDLEQREIERRENTNLRILEWVHDLQADEKETQSIQQVDISRKACERRKIVVWLDGGRPTIDNLSPVPPTMSSINFLFQGVR